MIQIDMPMPEACDVCPFNYDFCWCNAFGDYDNWEKYSDDWNKNVCERTTRPEYCPLKEQEAVVHPEPSCEMTYITDCCCDLCGVQLIREDNFCRCCGKRIEWEGR